MQKPKLGENHKELNILARKQLITFFCPDGNQQLSFSGSTAPIVLSSAQRGPLFGPDVCCHVGTTRADSSVIA